MPSYLEIGDTETLRLTVTVEGVPTDPTGLVLTIDAPDGTVSTETAGVDATIRHPSTGHFERDVTYTVPGVWAYEWTASGPTQVEGERVTVRRSSLNAIPRSLSLEDLKRRLDRTMDVDDDLLADDLAAAFKAAGAPPPKGCGRELSPDPPRSTDAAVTRTVLSTRRRVRIPDAREITTVTVDGTATTAYATLERDGLIVQLDLVDDGQWTDRWRGSDLQEGRAAIRRTIAVTGRFGFAVLPDDLAGAIYVLAARWHYERAALFADQVAVLEGTAVQSYYRQIPPRVALAFAAYAIPPAVAGLR